MALLYIVGLFCFRDGGGGCLSRLSYLVDVTNTLNIYIHYSETPACGVCGLNLS